MIMASLEKWLMEILHTVKWGRGTNWTGITRWLGIFTSGSSGKMLSTSLLYLGLSAPQQPQTPEGDKAREWLENMIRFTEIHKVTHYQARPSFDDQNLHLSHFCHDLLNIWAFYILIADPFLLTCEETIFRRALAEPHFIFESASSVFTHHFILVKCSMRITRLNARTKAECKIAVEDKSKTAKSVFIVILNT